MKKLLFLLMLPMTMQAQTLQECQEAAEHNYPLIRQYDLIGKTTQLTWRTLGKGGCLRFLHRHRQRFKAMLRHGQSRCSRYIS